MNLFSFFSLLSPSTLGLLAALTDTPGAGPALASALESASASQARRHAAFAGAIASCTAQLAREREGASQRELDALAQRARLLPTTPAAVDFVAAAVACLHAAAPSRALPGGDAALAGRALALLEGVLVLMPALAARALATDALGPPAIAAYLGLAARPPAAPAPVTAAAPATSATPAPPATPAPGASAAATVPVVAVTPQLAARLRCATARLLDALLGTPAGGAADSATVFSAAGPQLLRAPLVRAALTALADACTHAASPDADADAGEGGPQDQQARIDALLSDPDAEVSAGRDVTALQAAAARYLASVLEQLAHQPGAAASGAFPRAASGPLARALSQTTDPAVAGPVLATLRALAAPGGAAAFSQDLRARGALAPVVAWAGMRGRARGDPTAVGAALACMALLAQAPESAGPLVQAGAADVLAATLGEPLAPVHLQSALEVTVALAGTEGPVGDDLRTSLAGAGLARALAGLLAALHTERDLPEAAPLALLAVEAIEPLAAMPGR